MPSRTMDFESIASADCAIRAYGRERNVSAMARRRRRFLVLASAVGAIMWWREKKMTENDATFGAKHR